MTNEPIIKKELYPMMKSLKMCHNQGIQLNIYQQSLPERAAEVF